MFYCESLMSELSYQKRNKSYIVLFKSSLYLQNRNLRLWVTALLLGHDDGEDALERRFP